MSDVKKEEFFCTEPGCDNTGWILHEHPIKPGVDADEIEEQDGVLVVNKFKLNHISILPKKDKA